MHLRVERKAEQAILATLLVSSVTVGLTPKPVANGLVIGSIDFVEIFFVAGQNLERRSPKVGEEFVVKARVRNIGPAVIYYLPTLCDSSLSAVFDPSYVRLESGRQRCLAASVLTPLRPGEETTVWAPESGTAYVAVRAGSTTATAIFTYSSDTNADQLAQAEARSTVPLRIEGELANLPVPGFPIESLILGFVLALGILLCEKKFRAKQNRL